MKGCHSKHLASYLADLNAGKDVDDFNAGKAKNSALNACPIVIYGVFNPCACVRTYSSVHCDCTITNSLGQEIDATVILIWPDL